MARASFFTLLLSLWKKKYFSANPITPSEDGRRAFLHASSAVLASSTLSACTSTLGALTGSNAQRVVVVGAGLAGLHCAYRLFEAGVDVTVYEAAQRTGGRTYSTPKGHFKGGQVAEFGGELIDSDHLVMQYFAQEFNLQLDNLPSSLPANITYGYQYNIDGEFLTQEAIISLFEPIAKAVQSINMDLAFIENNHGLKAMYAKRWALDRETTLVEFLRHNNASPTLMKVINFAFVGEFGLEIHELSVLLNEHIQTEINTQGTRHLWEMRVSLYGDQYNFAQGANNTPVTLFAGKTLGFSACYIDNDNSIPESRFERESMMGSVDSQGHLNDEGYINADAFGTMTLVEGN
jgi:hypothetical protein